MTPVDMAIVDACESANGADAVPIGIDVLEQGVDDACASSVEELCLGESWGIGYGTAGGPVTTG
jgi:hypothetical protein